MKDTITEEDMLLDLTKTEIEKRLLKTEQENEILKENLETHNSEVRKLKTLMQVYIAKLKQLEESSTYHSYQAFWKVGTILMDG